MKLAMRDILTPAEMALLIDVFGDMNNFAPENVASRSVLYRNEICCPIGRVFLDEMLSRPLADIEFAVGTLGLIDEETPLLEEERESMAVLLALPSGDTALRMVEVLGRVPDATAAEVLECINDFVIGWDFGHYKTIEDALHRR